MLILFCSKLGIVYWLMSVKMQIWLSYCPTSTAHLLSLWLDVGFVAVCLSEGIGQRSLDLGKLFLFHAFWNSVCGRTKAVAGGFPPGESGRYLEILPGRSQMSVFLLFFFLLRWSISLQRNPTISCLRCTNLDAGFLRAELGKQPEVSCFNT